jgi:uncharacterized protein YciI
MQTYLYKIQPVRPAMLTEGPTAREAEVVSQHFDYLQGLLQQGVLLLAGRTLNTDYSTFGIAIFQAENDEAARLLCENDPAIRERVMRAEIYPYRIALLDMQRSGWAG